MFVNRRRIGVPLDRFIVSHRGPTGRQREGELM
jgi:hypothetical protein